jgi:Flp pilus assembly protein TadD
LGWAYHLGSKPNAALEPMLRAEELDPHNPRIQYRLGEIYRALGQAGNATAAYEQAIDLDWGGTMGERARKAIE